MKKILVLGLALALSFSAFSQFQFKGVGAGLSLGSQAGYSSNGSSSMGLGININGLAQVTDKIDAEASFSYFFPSEYNDPFFGFNYKMNIMTLSANGRYNFYQESGITAYGLAGLNLSIFSFDIAGATSSASELGLNIGVGGAYEITTDIDATAQIGYTIGDADQLFINLGVLYKF